MEMATTTDPTRLLCALLGYAGHQVAAHQFASVEKLAPFVDAGWLLPAPAFAPVLCEACEVAHYVEVVSLDGRPHAICMLSGEASEVAQTNQFYRVNELAVASSLALALQLDGEARTVRKIPSLWTLGAGTLGDTRVKFFFTPNFGRLDDATSVLDAAAQQSIAMKSALIVASDHLDLVRLALHRINVIPLRDLAKVGATARFSIDEALLLSKIFPEAIIGRGRGRMPKQRKRILPILDEMAGEGLTIDKSNEIWRIVDERFKHRHPGVASPAKSSILAAIDYWQCHSK
jgi:hypothetical protein